MANYDWVDHALGSDTGGCKLNNPLAWLDEIDIKQLFDSQPQRKISLDSDQVMGLSV